MNMTQLAAFAAFAVPFILQAAPLLIAPVASWLTTAAEKAPPFPYQGRTKAGIVAALLVTALIVRVALAWVTGTLAGTDWNGEVAILIDALAGAGIAAGGYALVTSDRPTT